jgi:hypothetical protein
MGLMQLLTVGRSLSEARDRPHRYRMTNSRWPTFGHYGSDGERVPAVMRQRCEAKTEMKTETVTGRNADVKQAFPQGRWTLNPNPFKSERSTPRPAVADAVQGELSLDKVKPVRNDLSDSDLELIPAAAPKVTVEQNVFAAPEAPVVAMGWWARMKARLLRKK